MDIIKKNFGEKLKNLRKIKGFTQEKLAEKIGINLRQLARIEAGESFISSETLFNICIILEISPGLLFDFDVLNETLMTGSGEVVHFNVINNGNVIQLLPKNIQNYEASTSDYKENLKDLDDRMKALASKIHREIIVDELQDGIVYLTKIFKPSGEIEIRNNKNSLLEDLKNKIKFIANDQMKLEFLNLALDSLTNKDALNELKILIKGIELSLKN